MHALIVLAHPTPGSLTHAVAQRVADGILSAAPDATVEVADLAAEGFDPRFGAGDFALYHGAAAAPPADVLAEQARLDRADAIVLVFPVWWWGMPAQLKGWIDRVFTRGWAFEYEDPSGRLVARLRDRPVRLLPIGAGDAPSYDRHGYREAMETQIHDGIFNFSGILDVRSTFLFDSEDPDPAVREALLETASAVGREIFAPAVATAPGLAVAGQ